MVLIRLTLLEGESDHVGVVSRALSIGSRIDERACTLINTVA